MTEKTKIDWPVLIEEQQKSGKTICRFCQEKGISKTGFYKAPIQF